MKVLKGEQLGTMDQRILIQQPVAGQSESGAVEISYIDVASIWAALDYTKSGSQEVVQSEAIHTFTAINFRIRKNTSWTPKASWRIIYQDQAFDIQHVLPYPGGAFYEIRAILTHNQGATVQLGITVVDQAGITAVDQAGITVVN